MSTRGKRVVKIFKPPLAPPPPRHHHHYQGHRASSSFYTPGMPPFPWTRIRYHLLASTRRMEFIVYFFLWSPLGPLYLYLLHRPPSSPCWSVHGSQPTF